MKAFEEWYPEARKQYCMSVHGPMRDAWRAALEWVIGQFDTYWVDDGNALNVSEKIQQELEDR